MTCSWYLYTTGGEIARRCRSMPRLSPLTGGSGSCPITIGFLGAYQISRNGSLVYGVTFGGGTGGTLPPLLPPVELPPPGVGPGKGGLLSGSRQYKSTIACQASHCPFCA